MEALSFSILALLAVWVVFASRLMAALGMVAGVLFLTQGHSIDIAGSNLFPARILTYVCFLRVMFRGEFSTRALTRMDWAMVVLFSYATLMQALRGDGSVAGLAARLMDAMFGYFAFRGLLREPDELRWFLHRLLLLLGPYLLLLCVESFTHNNLFSIVGGTSEVTLRDGHPRCYGSFRHPSLMGSLGAVFLPLFAALLWNPAWRRHGVTGLFLCLGIVGFSNSGSPVSAVLIGIIGWAMWPMRRNMRAFRWGFAGFVVLMDFLMKAPVYYLLAKFSAITGGSGWHRSYLIDVSLRHISQWWLTGMSLEDTKHWFAYMLEATGGADITNQYIAFGLAGGVLAIGLFIYLLYCAYSMLGRAMLVAQTEDSPDQFEERLVWGLGVALTVHAFNWMAITYFDQFQLIWLFQAAVICSVSEHWLLRWRQVTAEDAAPAGFGMAGEIPVGEREMGYASGIADR
ncbi:MAG: hypothetical protein HKN82_04600 [Akkermansiaceae bacterium]|nr:hypothetical protein [Akkermansiaceae bacterium]